MCNTNPPNHSFINPCNLEFEREREERGQYQLKVNLYARVQQRQGVAGAGAAVTMIRIWSEGTPPWGGATTEGVYK